MGKGDKRRPTAISDSAFSMQWCRTMGHRMRETSDVCLTCGMTAKEIAASEEMVRAPTRAGARRRKQRAARDAE